MVVDVRWHQNLSFVRDTATDEIVEVVDELTGDIWPLEDVLNFTRARIWLFNQSVEKVEKWCKENLTDQRFIIKVVSSFST
jgi:hypothetical protein